MVTLLLACTSLSKGSQVTRWQPSFIPWGSSVVLVKVCSLWDLGPLTQPPMTPGRGSTHFLSGQWEGWWVRLTSITCFLNPCIFPVENTVPCRGLWYRPCAAFWRMASCFQRVLILSWCFGCVFGKLFQSSITPAASVMQRVISHWVLWSMAHSHTSFIKCESPVLTLRRIQCWWIEQSRMWIVVMAEGLCTGKTNSFTV